MSERMSPSATTVVNTPSRYDAWLLERVGEELHRQVQKFGEQNWARTVEDDDPDGDYFRSQEMQWRELNEMRFTLRKMGTVGVEHSWAAIELEEIFEALTADTVEAEIIEWIQVAAVAVAAAAARLREQDRLSTNKEQS